MAATAGSLFGIGMIVLLLVAILWILMPFAIFGTKPILRELLAEQKRTNKLLAEAADRAIGPTEVVLVGSRKREG